MPRPAASSARPPRRSGRPERREIAPLIAIVGNVGAGKTTAVRRLADRLGVAAIVEDYRHNPYLLPFYAEPRRWAFHSQLHFLTMSAVDERTIAAGAVKELTPHFVHATMTSEMHARQLIADDDFGLLSALTEFMTDALAAPDLVVLLDAGTDDLLERIARRGRDFERGLEWDFLDAVSHRYRESVAAWTGSPTVSIDTGQLDLRTGGGLEKARLTIELSLRSGA